MKRNILFLFIIILALSALACNLGGIVGGGSESDPGQIEKEPATTEVEQADETESDSEDSDTESGQVGGADETSETDQEADIASDDSDSEQETVGMGQTTGSFANPEEVLNSYRATTIMDSPDDEQEGFFGMSQIDEEWSRSNQARHTVMKGPNDQVMVEMIAIGEDSWISMGDGNWMYTPPGDPEQGGMSQDELMTDLEDMLSGMENEMDMLGTESIDGIKCRHYMVDTEFSMSMPVPEDMDQDAAAFMPTEIAGHVTGEIWIADEGGLPEVIILSKTLQEVNLIYESRDPQTMVYNVERQLYDLNEPIDIQPPEGAAEIPTISEGMPDFSSTEGGVAVEVVSLDTLDSYRAEVQNTIKMADGSEMPLGFTLEKVNDPMASHLILNMGMMPWTEVIQVEDTVWILMGETWMDGTQDDIESYADTLDDTLSAEENMVPLGVETIEGVQCMHYLYEFTMGETTLSKNLWVAEESDMKGIPIQGLYEMHVGEMTTVMQVLIYDINEPLSIQPPK